MSLRQARPTIRDVAAQAGVSVSSVSRVMNGEPHISPELHARIMRAVNRLRFEPHSAAQALRSRESKTIGCMVSDLSNPLYSEMINGAEEEFQRAGYVLMLAATRHEQDRETAFVSAVRRRRMDGLLLFAGDNAHTDFTGARGSSRRWPRNHAVSHWARPSPHRASPDAPRCCRVRSALPAIGRPIPR